MSSSSPTPESNKNTTVGFLSLILISIGVLLLGWGLMTVLNVILP